MLFQTSKYDHLQISRQVRPGPQHAWSRIVTHPLDGHKPLAFPKRWLSRQQFIKDRPKGMDVYRSGQPIFSIDLLRRHIRCRAGQRTALTDTEAGLKGNGKAEVGHMGNPVLIE